MYRQALYQYFGYQDFRGNQYEIVKDIMDGKDVLVVMPTGGGKSLCYLLPSLMMGGTALVISPLISLMKDQVDQLISRNISAAYINGLLSPQQCDEVMHKALQGQYQFLYMAPERFKHPSILRWIRKLNPRLIAVDEAHCISEWGHSFRPDYRKIGEVLDVLPSARVVAVTATATAAVQQDIVDSLKRPQMKIHSTGFQRDNLYYSVRYMENENHKLEILLDFVKKIKGSGVIYCSSRKMVDVLGDMLKGFVPAVYTYHGGLKEDDKIQYQEEFIKDPSAWMVATNAFGMGIDKPDIRAVIHYHIPSTMESYYQESGRAGRDGKRSYSIVLYSSEDRRLRQRLIDLSYPPQELIYKLIEILLDLETEWVDLKKISSQLHFGLTPYEIFNALLVLDKQEILRIEPQVYEEEQLYSVTIQNNQGSVVWDEKKKEILKKREEKSLEVFLEWVEQNTCREKGILQYFGEKTYFHDCGHCDVCLGRLDSNYHAFVAKYRYCQELFEMLKESRKRGAQIFSVSEFIIASNELLIQFSKGFPETREEVMAYQGVGLKNVGYIEKCLLPIIKNFKENNPEIAEQYKDSLEIKSKREKFGTRELKQKVLNGYLEGESIEHIAKKLNKSMGTIEGYLIKIMEEYPLDLDRFMSQEEQEIIRKTVSKNQFEKLRELKAVLPETISYFQLKLFLAFQNKKG